MTIEVTKLELDLMGDIVNDEYADGTPEGSSPWTWSIAGGSKSRAGILGSLVQKGIIEVHDHEGKGRNRDMYCSFTPAGIALWHEIFDKPTTLVEAT